MNKPNSLQEAMEGKLTEDELAELGTSFDIVGDIGVIKLPDSLLEKKEMIGRGLMKVHTHLNTVLLQTSPVKGELRTRDLEVIAGEEKTETVHKEYGCSFKVDLNKIYFSPRLSNERHRIAKLVTPGEIVTNMFAGVGCYSIMIAKHSKPENVYSIDKNEHAVEYMKENVRINKAGETVVPVLGDARDVIDEHLKEKSDRVLMPLPDFARDFFDLALFTLKPSGGVIHFYDVGEDPDVFDSSIKFVKEFVSDREVDINNKRVVRSYAPNLYHVVLDMEVKSL